MAAEVLEMTPYKNWVEKASGVSMDQVRVAMDFTKSDREQVRALHEVYQGIQNKLPGRVYTCAVRQDDLPGYDDASAFTM